MSGFGSFLEGLSGGIGMGLKAKQFKQQQAMKDTGQPQAPTGMQATQATAQNAADSSTGLAAGPTPVARVEEQAGMGLPKANTMWTKTATSQNAQQGGGSILANIKSLINGWGE